MKLIIPNFWREKTLLSVLLKPLAFIYDAVSTWLRRVEPADLYYPKAKVITIGNITMGGTGKTPVALAIMKILQNYSKHKIAILTRGYKGKLIGPIMVDNSHNVMGIGDEALLLAKQVSTCVSKDRLQGIKFLESQGYDIIITDDGLQDERFIKALTIMVVDSYFGFGNGLIFPAGPLREKIESGINKANFIVVIGDGEFKLAKGLPVLYANFVSKVLLNGQKLVAFAGIGNPDKFFRSVIEAEGVLIEKIAFGDHHQYTIAETESLLNLANAHQANLITTEKDYMRIDDQFKDKIQTLPVSLMWKNEDILLKRLLAL